jgi:hypothetical protein
MIGPFFYPRILFGYAYIKASIKKGIVVGPSEIGCGSERSAIERRTKIGGKKHRWLSNDRKVNTTMWYIMSRIIADFWNNPTFC